MPDLSGDFERIEDRVLQVFGLSRTFLMGAGEGQTYAADALNKQLVEQLMTTYQKMLMRHCRERMLVVAEAQEHYDYEERNGRRFVIMEEVLETDEETGEKRITEQPKLLVPELKCAVLNFRDEDTTRQFTEALRASGIPISARTRTRGLGIDLDEERERSQDEAVADIIAQARTRRQAFVELRNAGLPVPADLMLDFAPKAQVEGVPPAVAGEQMMIDRLGTAPAPLPDLAPTPEDAMAAEQQDEMTGGPLNAPPQGEDAGMDEGMDSRPPESDEQRGSMPKPASRRGMPKQGALFRRSERVRRVAHLARAVDQAEQEGAAASGDPGEPYELSHHLSENEALAKEGKGGWVSGPALPAYQDPSHVGIRSRLGVTEDDGDLADYGSYDRKD
jgi:hypothetical protein